MVFQAAAGAVATSASSAALESAKSSDGLINQAFKVAVLIDCLVLVALALWIVTWLSGDNVSGFFAGLIGDAATLLPTPLKGIGVLFTALAANFFKR